MEIIGDMFHGFDLSTIGKGLPTAQISLVIGGMDHIVAQDDGKARFLKLVTEMKHALALVWDHDVVRANRDRIAFFQAVGASIKKNTDAEGLAA